MYDRLHDERPFHDGSFQNWAKESSAEFPFHYRDGVTIVLFDHDANPGDEFTTDESADPRSVAAEQLVGEVGEGDHGHPGTDH
jgi:hypothetical protein